LKIRFIHRLKTKFIINILIFFIIFLFTIFYLYSSFRDKIILELQIKLQNIAKIILFNTIEDSEREYLIKTKSPDIENPVLKNLQKKLFKIKELLELQNIYIINQDLEFLVIADTTYYPSSINFQKDKFEIENALKTGKIQVSRLFRTYQGKYILLCYAALDSIADKSEKKNLLVVEASSDLFEVLNKIRQKLLLIIALSLTILLISSLFFSNQVISPILAMIKKIEKISEGNFNERIIISQKNNELNFLAEAFNQMLDNISKLNQILKEKEYNATKRAETIEMKFKESEYLYFLGTMAAIVAHEVRNPLSGISGYVELLERKISEKNENTERLLNKIKEEIKKLNKVTTDFLFLAAPKKMELIKTDIRKMIIDILKLLEKEINVKNIKIENNIKEETFILCDIVYFEKALINIIKNAIAAVDEKNGKIIFECFEKKENNKKYFVLNIKDNGKGIDEETKERLFSLFYTSKKHGTGLGLVITKKIIELHNGAIDIFCDRGYTTVNIILERGE